MTEQEQQQEHENKRIRPRERALGQKGSLDIAFNNRIIIDRRGRVHWGLSGSLGSREGSGGIKGVKENKYQQQLK